MASKPSIVSRITSARAKELYGNLAQTNYYQVYFGEFSGDLKKFLKENTFETGFNFNNFISQDLGLLCSEANLPSSSYATSEVKDNYMGITQEFAHTRLYTDVDFSFYVDNNYRVLRFFEGWMDYVGGGSEVAASSNASPNVYRRFNYPENYKVNSMNIMKFNRDAQSAATSSAINYTFVNAFPKSVTSIPVSYGPAETLKVTVTFNYDRYLTARNIIRGTENETSVPKDSITNLLRNIDINGNYIPDPASLTEQQRQIDFYSLGLNE